MDDVDLAQRMNEAKRGDEAAVRELLYRFEDEVRMVVRRKLPQKLRSQFDSMDFVQTVWQSVFTSDRPDPGMFENERHFRAFLCGVAKNKVLEQHRRLTMTAKYDLSRQEPLYVRRGNREISRDVAGSDPTPSQDAQAGDRLKQLLKGRTTQEREVVELRRREMTYGEIGERLGIHESTARRIVDSIREDMEASQWR